MKLEIRLLRENESELANNFFNGIYKSNRSLENFKWEFVNGPNGKAIYVIAVDESESSHTKVVGIQCAIPLEFLSSTGEKILTAKSEDTLVDPNYRGQKIFERMYELLFSECKKAGICYIWGFTPAVKAFERIGFQAPFIARQALMVIRPLSAYSFLNSLNPKNKASDTLKILGLSIISFIYGMRRILTSKTTLNQTNKLNTHIFTAYKGTGYISLDQSESYLSWRLTKNPFGNKYHRFQFIRDGVAIADAIVNVREKTGYIEQLLLDQRLEESEKRKITKSVIEILLANSVSLIRVLCFNTNEELKSQEQILQSLGFITLHRGNHFVWKVLQDRSDVTLDKILLNRLFLQGNM